MVDKIRETLKNKEGNMFLFLMMCIVLFIGVSGLILDFFNLHVKSTKIKHAMNFAVKASSLQILEGEELADGVFLIDPFKAKEAFDTILAKNIGLNEYTFEPLEKSLVYERPNIREFHVENTFPINYYSSTLNNTFPIENPTTIAVIEFKVRGILLKRTIRVSKLSSSQLTSVYAP